MQTSRICLYLTLYLIFGTVAVLTVNGQQPPLPGVPDAMTNENAVPDGIAGRVSDWALAGMVWSDACLTQKVVRGAMENETDKEQQARYETLQNELKQLISELEQFGWKRVARPVAATKPSLDGGLLPRGIARVDTETPAGFDDPGLDDERSASDSRLNINRYRVDDYIDETPRERDNVPDALEDGVEKAIARHGLPLVGQAFSQGRISRRESQTRSDSMPYSFESIYDSEDYDPDVDYRPNNPDAIDDVADVKPGVDPFAVSADRFGDNDDDVNPLDPAVAIEGEDELLADIMRNDNLSNESNDGYGLDRYTADRGRFQKDADWLQLQLNANEMMWKRLLPAVAGQDQADRLKSVEFARLKLVNTLTIAFETSGDERLKSLLEPIVTPVR